MFTIRLLVVVVMTALGRAVNDRFTDKFNAAPTQAEEGRLLLQQQLPAYARDAAQVGLTGAAVRGAVRRLVRVLSPFACAHVRKWS